MIKKIFKIFKNFNLIFLILGIFFCYENMFSKPGIENIEEVFLRANDLCLNKKYKEAKELYLSIEKKGPVLFYNIAKCEYELKNYVSALVFYNRAKKESDFGLLSDANHNILLLNEKLGVQKAKAFEKFYEILEDFTNIFSIFSLQVYFIIFWFLFFFIYVFMRKLRKIFLLINFCFVIVFSILVFIKYNCKLFPAAIAKSKTEIFSGPNKGYYKLQEVGIGSKLKIKKIEDNWYKVKFKNVTGWVSFSDLEVI